MSKDRDFSILFPEDQNFIQNKLERGQISGLKADELVLKLLSSDEYSNHGDNDRLRQVRRNIPKLGSRKKDKDVARLDSLTNGWHMYRRNDQEVKWHTSNEAREMIQPIDLEQDHSSWMLDENFLTIILDRQRHHLKSDITHPDRKGFLNEINEFVSYPENGNREYQREIDQELNLQTLDRIADNGDRIKVPNNVCYNWQTYWDETTPREENWERTLALDSLPGSEVRGKSKDKHMDHLLYRNTVLGVIEDIGEIAEIRDPGRDEDLTIYEEASRNGDTIITMDKDFYGDNPFPRARATEKPDVATSPVAYRLARGNFN